MKTIITYGTFDLVHIGHVRLLQRARMLGERLVVGISTDEFNKEKGKTSIFPYEERASIISSMKCVDDVFPEDCWSQKINDFKKFNASIFVMGDDWTGKFDHFQDAVEVIYLPRTAHISTTQTKNLISGLNKDHIATVQTAVDILSQLVKQVT